MNSIKLGELRTSLILYKNELERLLKQTNFKYLDTALKYLNTEIDRLTKMIDDSVNKEMKEFERMYLIE